MVSTATVKMQSHIPYGSGGVCTSIAPVSAEMTILPMEVLQETALAKLDLRLSSMTIQSRCCCRFFAHFEMRHAVICCSITHNRNHNHNHQCHTVTSMFVTRHVQGKNVANSTHPSTVYLKRRVNNSKSVSNETFRGRQWQLMVEDAKGGGGRDARLG
jgi:hypothetical protein